MILRSTIHKSSLFRSTLALFPLQLVGSIPGVDPNDPAIKDALKKEDADKKDGDKKE